LFLSRWLREPVRKLAAFLGIGAPRALAPTPEEPPVPGPSLATATAPDGRDEPQLEPPAAPPPESGRVEDSEPGAAGLAPIAAVATRPDGAALQHAAEADSQIVVAPDPEVEALLEKIAGVESMLAELVARQADMQQVLQAFQLRQYQVLGDCLAEVLRLRLEHAQAVAARSGLADDAARARRAADDLAGLSDALSPARHAPPELDDATRDELKRLYRTVAMRCHPDRVGEADKAVAHERFQRAQLAYRNRDLAALNALGAEMDLEPGAAAQPTGPAAAAELSRRLVAMRNAAADLILAIQTLQLDADYRRALARDDWDDYFDDARASFEHECAALREAIAAL